MDKNCYFYPSDSTSGVMCYMWHMTCTLLATCGERQSHRLKDAQAFQDRGAATNNQANGCTPFLMVFLSPGISGFLLLGREWMLSGFLNYFRYFVVPFCKKLYEVSPKLALILFISYIRALLRTFSYGTE